VATEVNGERGKGGVAAARGSWPTKPQTTNHISMLQILSLQLNAFKCISLLPAPGPRGLNEVVAQSWPQNKNLYVAYPKILLLGIRQSAVQKPKQTNKQTNNKRALHVKWQNGSLRCVWQSCKLWTTSRQIFL